MCKQWNEKTYPISKNPFLPLFPFTATAKSLFLKKILKFTADILFIIEKRICKSETERIK